jgi:hypothetical protein
LFCLLGVVIDKRPDAMTVAVNTHDSWGTVKVGDYQTLELT